MDPLILLGAVIAAQTTYLTATSITSRTKTKTDSIICDTSALIDGRILSIARSGFVGAKLIVPRSVVRELQMMADKADHDKRERARYGLDVIQTLQAMEELRVEIYDDGVTHTDGVDEQLIVLAKKFSAKLCTTDYNLNKVARVESIKVVNVNELAHALRPMHLPGEMIMIELVQPGQGQDQAVGYLDDGTMVVVDKAKKHINASVEVEVVRVLQTEAGRMLFARLKGDTRTKKPFNKPSKDQSRKQSNRKPLTAEDELIKLANQ